MKNTDNKIIKAISNIIIDMGIKNASFALNDVVEQIQFNEKFMNYNSALKVGDIIVYVTHNPKTNDFYIGSATMYNQSRIQYYKGSTFQNPQSRNYLPSEDRAKLNRYILLKFHNQDDIQEIRDIAFKIENNLINQCAEVEFPLLNVVGYDKTSMYADTKIDVYNKSNNTFVNRFNGIYEILDELDVTMSGVCNCLAGRYKYHHNLIFKIVE